MQWSKLKTKLKDLIAPGLRKRIDFHLTRFREAHDQVGRAWVTVDGEEILDCSFARWEQAYVKAKDALLRKEGGSKLSGREIGSQAMKDVEAQQVFSEKDFVSSLTRYLEFPIKDALSSNDPFIRAFALVDRRVGRRSFEKLKVSNSEHPLVQAFYKLRLESFVLGKAGIN